MARLSIPALLVALVACHDAVAPRADTSALEARVLQRVAEDVQRCPNQDALRAFFESKDDEVSACLDALVVRRNVEITVSETCSGLVADRIRALAVHRDGCSPSIVGVAELPLFSPRLIHAGRVIELRVRQMRPREGLELVSAFAHVAQDSWRGRTNLLAAMLGVAATGRPFAAAQELIATATADDANAVAPLFDELLAREPAFADTVRGDHDHSALHLGVAALHPATWQPPGGRGDFTSHPPSDGNVAPFLELIEQHEAALARERIFCPPTATLRDCWIGTVAFSAFYETRMFQEYARKVAANLSHLAALRVALEVRREARCPDAGELESPRYTALRRPAALGDTVVVTRTAAGLEISAPAWARRDKTVWTVACP